MVTLLLCRRRGHRGAEHELARVGGDTDDAWFAERAPLSSAGLPGGSGSGGAEKMVQLYSDLAARTDGVSISASPPPAQPFDASLSTGGPSDGADPHGAGGSTLSVLQSQLLTKQILSAVDGDSVDDL